MMRFVVCLSALIGLASATRAKDMKDESFAWPWDRDSHHAVPHHLGGLMAARAKVHHGDMFDTSSSDFSSDSDSSSSGGDFMDQYIKETGQKPMQIDDDKAKSQKQDSEPTIPDMASLFNDNSNAQAQSKPQQPWADQSSSSTSSNMDSLFGGSFGFDTSSKAVDTFDTPAKPARHVDNDSHTDDMTNLFGGSSTDSAASGDAAAATSDSTSGWPWDTHPKKKESEEHHSRDLWSSHSDSDTAGGNSNSAASDMENLFGGSTSGSTSNSMFSGWSSNDFGGKSPSSNDFGVSQPAKAPQQDEAPQRSADSPIQGPTQRESSISGATATDQVVDVRLSSELQQSLLQARNAETKMLQRFRGVSN